MKKTLTAIKVRKAVVRLASPFWRNQELHRKTLQANFILLDAVFILTQLHMTYCRPAEMEDNCGAPWWRSLSSDLQQMNGTLRGH